MTATFTCNNKPVKEQDGKLHSSTVKLYQSSLSVWSPHKLNKTCYWPNSPSPVIEYQITSLSLSIMCLHSPSPVSPGKELISQAGGLIQCGAG